MQYKLDGDADWKTGTTIDTSFTGDNNKAYKLQESDKSKKGALDKIKNSRR